MFGLPAVTVAVIFGIPAIWVIYTVVFVFLSRHWSAEDIEGDDSSLSGPEGTGLVDPSIQPRTENGGLA
ncbi:hypothetical protein [Brevibacterium sp.]|uniref:hypothetical protein n=1 Tax=Brevibacterium sp. TaxID=1701 RepID=UPI00281228D2|nr:hypothetical protein [Brevibacterium sp.]